MDRLITRIKEILEKSEKIEVEESIVPPKMEVRIREKSVFFTGGSRGSAESIAFTGRDFSEAYRVLSRAVVDGELLFERNIEEPGLSYLKSYCADFLKNFEQ